MQAAQEPSAHHQAQDTKRKFQEPQLEEQRLGVATDDSAQQNGQTAARASKEEKGSTNPNAVSTPGPNCKQRIQLREVLGDRGKHGIRENTRLEQTTIPLGIENLTTPYHC